MTSWAAAWAKCQPESGADHSLTPRGAESVCAGSDERCGHGPPSGVENAWHGGSQVARWVRNGLDLRRVAIQRGVLVRSEVVATEREVRKVLVRSEETEELRSRGGGVRVFLRHSASRNVGFAHSSYKKRKTLPGFLRTSLVCSSVCSSVPQFLRRSSSVCSSVTERMLRRAFVQVSDVWTKLREARSSKGPSSLDGPPLASYVRAHTRDRERAQGGEARKRI